MPVRRRSEQAAWFLGAAFLLAAAWAVGRHPSPSFPLFERPVMEDFAVQDMGAVVNGARRLGADLAFIELLQYYGSPENAHPDHPRGRRALASRTIEEIEERESGHVHIHMGHEGEAETTDRPSGAFPELKDYAFRAGALDPRFHFSFLFTAGALAFNLNRVDEALAVLEAGARGDPSFWRYQLYAGAIAYRKNQEMDKAISRLEEAVLDPECPSMVKNILANIYRKQGNLKRVAEIYLDMANSRDKSYASFAVDRLKELSARHPAGK